MLCAYRKRFVPPTAQASFSSDYTIICEPPTQQSGWGGVAIAVLKDLPFVKVTLHTKLQAVAVTLEVPTRKTYVSLYIPPSFSNDGLKEELFKLVQQMPKPFMIMGDFNAHSEIWGCSNTDLRGRIVVSMLGEYDLDLLNDGSPTFLSLSNGSQSAIDLTISSEHCNNVLWEAIGDQHGSDHFPILLKISSTRSFLSTPQRWKYSDADWMEYQRRVASVLDPNTIYTADKISEIIFNVALSCIPRTSGKLGGKRVPWWTNEVAAAIKSRRKASFTCSA